MRRDQARPAADGAFPPDYRTRDSCLVWLRPVLATRVLYTLGRTLTCLILGALLVASPLSIPEVGMFLQTYMNKVLNPLLPVMGRILLGVVPLRFSTSAGGERLRQWAESAGVWGGLRLGMIFALAVCPVSAALFFGSLIPLALDSGSSVARPSLYETGTGLPVFAFAVLIGLGAQGVGRRSASSPRSKSRRAGRPGRSSSRWGLISRCLIYLAS